MLRLVMIAPAVTFAGWLAFALGDVTSNTVLGAFFGPFLSTPRPRRVTLISMCRGASGQQMFR